MPQSKSPHSPDELKNVSYYKKPDGLTMEEWQIALRKQFVVDKPFGIEKTDNYHPVYGDYTVHNFVTQNRYKVALRDNVHSTHFCSCLDFKTNRLGTCKHIEAVLFKLNSNPTLREALNKEYLPPYTSVCLSYSDTRTVRIRIGSDSANDFSLLAKSYFDENNTLKKEAFGAFDSFLEKAYALDRNFRCYPDALSFVLEVREQNKRIQTISTLYPHAGNLKGLLKTELFPFQQEGVLFATKAGRSLIADEMGLGKTIQALGVAELLKKQQQISSVLIICPTSLKYQWQSEIERFSTSTAGIIEGPPNVRTRQYTGDEFYKIVSYHTVVNDVSVINQAGFDLIILDEAQRIKNWKTKVALSVKKVKSPYCVVLTGTPLENKLEELYSIIQYIDPYRFGPSYQFISRYQVRNESGKIVGYQHLNEIALLLKGLVIRRTKKEVQTQLPERTDKILYVPMTAAQRKLHDDYNIIVARLVQKWQRMGFLNEKDRQNLLINLNLMRMVCDSTYIVDQTTRHDSKIHELMNILEEFLEQTNEKIVIFSQWERMTRLIAQELDLMGIRYEYLHGGIPAAKRKALFDNFNNEAECRIFLSTDTGSTGLNLQAASMLVNLDIPWNPAVLEQRIARIHRLGQKENVNIINFVSKDTIEERMLSLHDFKSSLAKGILDLGEDSIFMDDTKFRKFMQTVSKITDIDHADHHHPLHTDENEAAAVREDRHTMVDTQTSLMSDDHFFGDDDILSNESEQKASEKDNDPAVLVSQGIAFLSGLSKTLASPEKTAELVASITEKDPKSGQTYLKIAVGSEEVVANILKIVGKLFK